MEALKDRVRGEVRDVAEHATVLDFVLQLCGPYLDGGAADQLLTHVRLDLEVSHGLTGPKAARAAGRVVSIEELRWLQADRTVDVGPEDEAVRGAFAELHQCFGGEPTAVCGSVDQ